MAKETKIEWADATWNPWRGCTPVSPGCDNCYAARGMKRWGQDPRKIVQASDTTFYAPDEWKEPKRIFVCSWSDFFHPQVPWTWRARARQIMFWNKQHTFLILTKRPERIKKGMKWPKNVWLGVTVENQEQANKRVPLLLQIPAAKRFVSVEPMLGEIDLNGTPVGQVLGPCDECGHRNSNPKCEACMGIASIDHVICGCESGPKRRHTDIGWIRDLRDQCKDSGTPFFLKQMEVNGKVMKMPKLDGREWNEFPKQ